MTRQDLPAVPDLPTTAYALLGLLTLGDDLTGYELKRRADNTLRFYWSSPAMSQVYTELARLAEHGLVAVREDETAPVRRTRRYRITATGRRDLARWLGQVETDFPLLKHPIALRLLLGHLIEPDQTKAMLERYLDSLARRRQDLQTVRDSLGEEGDPERALYRYPRMVADWGLEYYESERVMVTELISRLDG
ncbi:MAG TPA: PadR family transcriptional regulator [Nocardioidaceae bacterium]|jgi:DNA-binding PadR family transcriptional regulator